MEWYPNEKFRRNLALRGYDAAAKQVLAMLDDGHTRGVLARPRGNFALWRERAFDLLHDGEWISGIMDRVVIELNEEGAPLSAWLIDFKTDFISDDEQLKQKVTGYRPQIELYIGALRKLTGLAAGSVRASLVFTRTPREVPIESLHR